MIIAAHQPLGGKRLAGGRPGIAQAERLAKEALANRTSAMEVAKAQAELAEAAAQLQAIRKLRQRR